MTFREKHAVTEGLGEAFDFSLKIHQKRKEKDDAAALKLVYEALDRLSRYDFCDSLALDSRVVMFYEQAGLLEERLGRLERALKNFQMAEKISRLRAKTEGDYSSFSYDFERNRQSVNRIKYHLKKKRRDIEK